jgi:hypothetical protein
VPEQTPSSHGWLIAEDFIIDLFLDIDLKISARSKSFNHSIEIPDRKSPG